MGVRCGVDGVSEPLDVACFFCEALDSLEACFLGRVGAMAFDVLWLCLSLKVLGKEGS